MSADLDDLLRDGMLRFTADLHAPAELAVRARRRRTRQRTLRTVSASGAAAVAIIAITVAAVSAGNARRSNQAGLTPKAAPVARFDLEYVRLTGSGEVSSEQIWAYGPRSRALFSSATGPIEDDGTTMLGSSRGLLHTIRTTVRYNTKLWARGSLNLPLFGLPAPTSCANPAVTIPGVGAALTRWISDLLELVACGDYAVSGTGRIDGVRVIKLVKTGSPPSPGSFATIYIEAASYVPVRMTGGRPATGWWRADLAWLRPTESNLALLNPTIPAGFRQVSLENIRNGIMPAHIRFRRR